jgi:biopolymer transport protein ExbD
MAVKIKKGSEMMQIPVVPLVDTVFNLLIFFLVATKVAEAEKELHVALPYATQAQALTVRPAEMIINIDQKGHYFIGSQPATLHELNVALRNASAASGGRTPVTLRFDKRCPSGFLMEAVDCCERNKIRQYHFTSKESPGDEK